MLGAAARRLSVRTGVSDAEASGSLPGDEIIRHPMVEWTRGVTVRTSAERIWPWLAQMGYGRGGWYTPEWVDLFANRWVFGVRAPFPKSADRLLPEYQHVAVGDLICDGPDYASFFRVEHVDPPHALVYRSIRHPRRGSPIDIDDPESPARVEQRAPCGRHLRRLHLGAGAEPASRRPDAAARTDARELRAAGPSDCWCCRWESSTRRTASRCCGRSPGVRRQPMRLIRPAASAEQEGRTWAGTQTNAQRPLRPRAPRRLDEPRFKLRAAENRSVVTRMEIRSRSEAVPATRCDGVGVAIGRVNRGASGPTRPGRYVRWHRERKARRAASALLRFS